MSNGWDDDFNTGEGPSFGDMRGGGFRHVLDREHLERFQKPKQYKEPFEPVEPDYTRGRAVDANQFLAGKYIKCSDLKGKAHRVIIESAAKEDMIDGEEKLVIYFQGKDKGLVLNKTNTSEIISQLGTAETDEWQGASIVLKPDRVAFNGQMRDCIRIGPKVKGQVIKPQAKPAPAQVQELDEDGPISDEDVPF